MEVVQNSVKVGLLSADRTLVTAIVARFQRVRGMSLANGTLNDNVLIIFFDVVWAFVD